jgi:hypothetical protein
MIGSADSEVHDMIVIQLFFFLLPFFLVLFEEFFSFFWTELSDPESYRVFIEDKYDRDDDDQYEGSIEGGEHSVYVLMSFLELNCIGFVREVIILDLDREYFIYSDILYRCDIE